MRRSLLDAIRNGRVFSTIDALASPAKFTFTNERRTSSRDGRASVTRRPGDAARREQWSRWFDHQVAVGRNGRRIGRTASSGIHGTVEAGSVSRRDREPRRTRFARHSMASVESDLRRDRSPSRDVVTSRSDRTDSCCVLKRSGWTGVSRRACDPKARSVSRRASTARSSPALWAGWNAVGVAIRSCGGRIEFGSRTVLPGSCLPHERCSPCDSRFSCVRLAPRIVGGEDRCTSTTWRGRSPSSSMRCRRLARPPAGPCSRRPRPPVRRRHGSRQAGIERAGLARRDSLRSIANQVRTVSRRYAAPTPNRRFGAQAASTGCQAPPEPIAAKKRIVIQYANAIAMPTPMPAIAPLRPIVTAKGTAMSAMTIVTNGNDSFLYNATR